MRARVGATGIIAGEFMGYGIQHMCNLFRIVYVYEC